MAKVLLSYWRSDELSAGATLNFWDGLIKELNKCGNDVLSINNAYFNIWTSNEAPSKEIENYILENVSSFDPDVILTFNNRILNSVLRRFDVPILLYDGDELKYFSDLSRLKKNLDRYHLLTIVKDWIKDYREFGFSSNQITYMPPGTAVRANTRAQYSTNISFLGQRRFFLSNKFFNSVAEGRDIRAFYDSYLHKIKNNEYNYASIFNRFERDSDITYTNEDLWPLFDDSFLTLAAVLDLGLKIGGHMGGWRDIYPFMPQLAVAHSKRRVFTLKENEDFYNASKISLSPIHPQARGKGFSWRSLDIMASNACLLSSYSSELLDITSKDVDLPMFNSPFEAREKAQLLLRDDKLREAIVMSSQALIEKRFRWPSRFEEMQNLAGVSFFEAKEGKLLKLLPEQTPSSAKIFSKGNFTKLSNVDAEKSFIFSSRFFVKAILKKMLKFSNFLCAERRMEKLTIIILSTFGFFLSLCVIGLQNKFINLLLFFYSLSLLILSMILVLPNIKKIYNRMIKNG